MTQHGRLRGFAEPRARRSEGPEPAVAADDAEVAVHEADDVSGVVLSDPHRLLDEAFADEDQLAPPAD